jgi:Domain of unknown function (DUF4386)
MNPLKKTARIAGAIYLSMVVVAPFSMIYVPSKLFVRGDAAATATNVLAHETMFDLAIVGGLIAHLIFICLAFALYRLLSDVNKTWAQLMVGLVLVSAAVGLYNTVNHLAAFNLFKGGQFLDAIDQTQRNALGMFFIRLHWQGDLVNEIFWGAWLFPFGLLVYRSGFLPRFIGGWLILNCFAWIVLCFIGLFTPGRYDGAFTFLQPFMFGELAIMLYLLIKGVKAPTGSVTPALAVA